MIPPDSKAVKELQPELEKLKSRASVRLREFLLDQIALLKKPKTNIPIVQKNVLSKYEIFNEFFKKHCPGVPVAYCRYSLKFAMFIVRPWQRCTSGTIRYTCNKFINCKINYTLRPTCLSPTSRSSSEASSSRPNLPTLTKAGVASSHSCPVKS
jgi:hypothetical protein